MKVDNLDILAGQQRLKSQAKSLKNLSTMKENEIEGVRKIYDKKVQDEKVIGLERTWEAQDQSNKEVAEVLNDKEKRLEASRNQLKKDVDQLEKSRQNITGDYRDRISYTTQFYEQKNKETYDNALSNAREIHENTQQQIKDMKGNQKISLLKMEQSTKADLDHIENNHRRRIGNQAQYYKNLQDQNEKLHEKEVNRITTSHAEELDVQKKENIREKKDKEVIHREELKRQDEYHRALMKQEKEAFEARYSQIQKNHQDMINRIQERFDEDTTKMMQAHTEKKHAIVDKAQDKFYRVQTIDHEVVDNGDSYLVSVKIPEHEKETLVLSVDKRRVNFNVTRRFKDSFEDTTGIVNKTKRSEVYSKHFDLPEIMDPEGITQEYKNGVLSYRIAKA